MEYNFGPDFLTDHIWGTAMPKHTLAKAFLNVNCAYSKVQISYFLEKPFTNYIPRYSSRQQYKEYILIL